MYCTFFCSVFAADQLRMSGTVVSCCISLGLHGCADCVSPSADPELQTLGDAQVNPMASVLGAQQFLSMGWPGQQPAAGGWGVSGWGTPGGTAMMWPSAGVNGVNGLPPQQQPGFAGVNPHAPQSVTPPLGLNILGGGAVAGFQPGLGHNTPNPQGGQPAPFLQPGGVLVTGAQFQPGYAGLQHIPGVDASSAGTGVAAAQPLFQPYQTQQPQQATLPQGFAAQGLMVAMGGPVAPGIAPNAVPHADKEYADPLRAKAEAITREGTPAGGTRARSRPGTRSTTASGDRVLSQSPAEGGGGGTAGPKAPAARAASRRQQRSKPSTDTGAGAEAGDAGADSRSPQETLKLSQQEDRTGSGRQQQQHQWASKRQRRSSPAAAAALSQEAQAAAMSKPPLQIGRSAAAAAAAAERQHDDEEDQQQQQAAAARPGQQSGTAPPQQGQAAAMAGQLPASQYQPAGAAGVAAAFPNGAALRQQQQQQQFAFYQQQMLQQQLAQQQQQQQVRTACVALSHKATAGSMMCVRLQTDSALADHGLRPA